MAIPFSMVQDIGLAPEVVKRNFVYWAKPTAPDAMERGARKIACQMKRKLIRRPSRFGP